MSKKIEIFCDFCGKKMIRYPSQIKRHNSCCKKCLANFSNKIKNPDKYLDLKDYTGQSENMKRINAELNSSRVSADVREKIRKKHLDSVSGKGYRKFYGVHEHRIVAEQMLGRKLKRGEVVHHINGNKRDNRSENLMVFKNQSEHVKWHIEHD